jgi:hypothetical protein
MKRGVILLIFGWVFICSSQGQWYNKYYENRNISDLNQQELSLLYQKSRNLKNIGMALTIAGITYVTLSSTALIILSITDILSAMSTGNPASLISYRIIIVSILAGTVAMTGGIPIWIVGHIRNKEVVTAINSRISGFKIYLRPSLVSNQVQNKYYPAISISFRF